MGAVSRFSMLEVPREVDGVLVVAEAARRVPRLAGPLSQWEPVVEGRPVREMVGPGVWSGLSLVSVLDGAFPGPSAAAAGALGDPARRDPEWAVLGRGRVPVAVCRVCGDLACGALTVAVDRLPGRAAVEVVRWSGLRVEDGDTPAEQMPDLSGVGPFVFDAAGYDRVLGGVGERLRVLVDRDAADRAEWAARHRVRAWVERHLG